MKYPKNRPPTPAGEILKSFLKDYGLTQAQFAAHLGWTTTKVNQLAKNKLTITPRTALTLADAFGNSPEFWLNAQMANDVYQAKQEHSSRVKRLEVAS